MDLETISYLSSLLVSIPVCLIAGANMHAYKNTLEELQNGIPPDIHRKLMDFKKDLSPGDLLYHLVSKPGRERAYRDFDSR